MKFYTHCKRGANNHALPKFLLVMKLIMFFLTVAILQVSAKGYSQKITIKQINAPLDKVLNEIRDQSGYDFFYDLKTIQKANPITINVKDASLDEVLKACFNNQPLIYKVEDKAVMIKERAPSLLPEVKEVLNIDITGKVTDTTGAPLPGATIRVKGSSQIAASDNSGLFSLKNVPENSILQISFVGFVTKEIKVTSQSNLTIKLLEQSSSLNDVVVVGYGKESKKFVTGSIVTVQGSTINDLPVSNVSNALAGRAAGLVVEAPSGLPGVGSSISVRGVTSYTGQDPLYVIDDVPRSKQEFDLISPTDIQSISVLKDGAAAIYGVRGGSGVILITTKHGGAHSAPILNFSMSGGASDPTKVPKRLTPYQDALYRNDYYMNQGLPANDPSYYSPDELNYFKTETYNPDEFKEISKTPYTTQANLSVTGGSDAAKYYISTGYYNETGLFNNLQAQRYNILSNVDVRISKDLSASINFQGTVKPNTTPWWYDGVGTTTLSDLTRTALNYTPLGPSYINGLPVGNLYHLLTSEIINKGGYEKENQTNINGFLKLNYTPSYFKGFGIDASYNYNKEFDLTKIRYTPYTMYLFNTTGTNGHIVGDQVVGSELATQNNYDYYEEDYGQNMIYVFNAGMHYNRSIKDNDFGLSVFYEQSETYGDTFSAQGQDLLSSTIDQLFVANSNPDLRSLTGGGTESGRESVFGRLNYKYKDKYIFEAILRADASSAFAPQNKWGYFPSLSAGWILSDEQFIKNFMPHVDNLKLRGSYGILGYDNVPLSQWYSYYSIGGNAVFDTPVNTISPSVYPNPNIKWQKVATTDISIDASFYKGLISGTLDLYYKNTSDLLVPNPTTVPTTFGATLADVNFGQVDAKGLEVTLRHDNRIGNVKYFVGLNFSYGTNKVIKYPEQAGIPDYERRTGRPVDFITGYVSNGVIANAQELAAYKNVTYNGRHFELGDIGFKDVNGDGVINSLDQVDLSNKSYDPRINYGIPLGASYKGFDINVLLQGVGDREVMISDRSQWQEQNVLSFWSDYWSPSNPQGKFPKIGGLNDTQDPASSFWLRNGSYLRFKSLEFGYSLPANVDKNLGIRSCRFYVVGTNLFMIHDSIGYYDAEYQTNLTGYGAFQYPIMRTVTFGLNIGF